MDGKNDYHVVIDHDMIVVSHDNAANIFPSNGLHKVMEVVDITSHKPRFYFASRNEKACMIILWD